MVERAGTNVPHRDAAHLRRLPQPYARAHATHTGAPSRTFREADLVRILDMVAGDLVTDAVALGDLVTIPMLRRWATWWRMLRRWATWWR